MTRDPSIFVVEEAGERLVVRFRDWRSSSEAFHGVMADTLAFETRHELEGLIDEHPCAVLAIDTSQMHRLPSSFLGVLIALSRGGLQIELLNLSPSVRQSLEVTRLDKLFVIRE
jgi:anti-anti-sigma regulatory factor